MVCLLNLDDEDNQRLSCALIEMLESWGVTPDAQINLLGLNGVKPRQLSKFKTTVPLPETGETPVRVEHLMGIADALRTSYPMNEQMGTLWLSQPHRRFAQRTPLLCMIEDGINGLLAVRRHLDCAFDWEQDEAGRGKA